MVRLNEREAVCVVKDTTPSSSQPKVTILVRPTTTVADLIKQVSTQFQYVKFELALNTGNEQVKIWNIII